MSCQIGKLVITQDRPHLEEDASQREYLCSTALRSRLSYFWSAVTWCFRRRPDRYTVIVARPIVACTKIGDENLMGLDKYILRSQFSDQSAMR
jgi:hypothetical protein